MTQTDAGQRDAAVQAAVDRFPPLTPDQVDEISHLLTRAQQAARTQSPDVQKRPA